MYVLAERLGKFAWEVLEQMPPDEYANWMILEKINQQKEKREAAKNKAKHSRR